MSAHPHDPDASALLFGLMLANLNMKGRHITATYHVPPGNPEGLEEALHVQVIPPQEHGSLLIQRECASATWSFRYATDEEVDAWTRTERLALSDTEGNA